TVTMLDGQRYVINVTDLDTDQNGVKPPLVTDTVNTIAEGIKITMFDYGPEKLDNVNNTYNSTDNSGINKGHTLKFYSYGTNGNTVNNFTGGAYAMQGVVQSKLGNDGYPVVNDGSETLRYLFDPDYAVNGKTVTSRDANYLFRRIPEHGMELFYDSDQNYAYLDGDNFKIYNDTYLEEGADYENPFRIGFYPYNDYDNRYHCIHGNNFNWGCKGSKDWRVRDQVGHYNHHFGMKVEGNFYMTDDKKITNEITGQKEDMRFKFSGDDDMWVFIDGVLVLDIGGIHNPVDGEINFTTGQVTVSAVKTANGGSAYALGANTTIAQAFAKAGKTWDDSPLSHHDIKIFYMERGGMYSNLAVTMNLPTFPHKRDVSLTKVSAGTDEPLKGAQFKLYSDSACQNEVKVKDSNDAPRAVVITSAENPKGRVFVENLIPGQKYYLKETIPPAGHKLDNTVYVIEVPTSNQESQPVLVYKTDANGNKTGDSVTNIENTPDAYGSFNFFKVEEGTSTKISGAEFTLYTDADCQTIAKDKEHHNLVSTSADSTGSTGIVSFANIPAGATYYMKETQEPQDYFPSSDVYRVVVSEDGNTVSVYKGSSTTPLFTNTTGDADRIIENKPKTEKTSISVEKQWEDGAANHTNDTVTIQLYDDVVDGPKTGGKLTLTVKADKWYDSANTSTEVNAPTTGNITYKVQKNEGGGWSDLFTGQELNTGNSWQKTYPDLPVKKDGTDIQYRVVSVTGDGTKVVTSAVYEPSDGTVSGGSGTIHLSGNVVTQTGPASAASVTVSAVTGINGNDWQITLSNFKIYYYNGYNYEEKGTYKDGSVILNYSNQQVSIDLPEHVYVDGNEVPKSQVRYGFMLQTSSVSGNSIYMRTTPNHYTYQGSEAIFHGGNGEFQIPADSPEIKIEFSGQPFTAGFFSYFSRQSAPRRAALSDSSIAEKGDSYTVQGTSQPVGSSVVLNNGTNGWTYTWSDLVQSETVTEDDYTFTRTHNYYVKEISVNLADGNEEDFVESTYSFVWNDDNDHSKGIKKVIISNRVPEKMSLQVTKEWQDAQGNNYTPEDNQKEIRFELYRVIEGGSPEGSVYKSSDLRTPVRYENGSWTTVTIDGLRKEIKDGSEIKNVSYYVKEVSPQADENLSVFYRTSDGREYADPADAVSNSDESLTIVNVNSERKISITKKWYYKNGTSLQEVAEPEVKEIFFK
ncbi:MAG: SpaA isopeptide-forming pilin-related protein, partial [Oscillospiraceae bacterium]|nr:SpaA isopeptide-forming pilin-related protein [Oscillospiraceae bacterium]